MNARLDALLNTQAPINQTHRYLASINVTSDGTNYFPAAQGSAINSYDRRAQVIAQFDYIRAELPDVFFLNSATTDGGTLAQSYPLNFAARALSAVRLDFARRVTSCPWGTTRRACL